MAKTYSDKLKDPRWQRKRLEILNRDLFTCQGCRSDTNTLHIHHKYYDFKLEPWEYNEKTLVTLCESCHTEMEHCRRNIITMLGFLDTKELLDLELKLLIHDFHVYERMYGKEKKI